MNVLYFQATNTVILFSFSWSLLFIVIFYPFISHSQGLTAQIITTSKISNLGDIVCDANVTACYITCDDTTTCHDITIQCPSNPIQLNSCHHCQINCTSTSSCHRVTINGTNCDSVDINAPARQSLCQSIIYAPETLTTASKVLNINTAGNDGSIVYDNIVNLTIIANKNENENDGNREINLNCIYAFCSDLKWNLYGNNLTLNILSSNEGKIQYNEFLVYGINSIVNVDFYDGDGKFDDNLIDIYGNNNKFLINIDCDADNNIFYLYNNSYFEYSTYNYAHLVDNRIFMNDGSHFKANINDSSRMRDTTVYTNGDGSKIEIYCENDCVLEGNVIFCPSSTSDNSYNIDGYSGNWSQISTNNNNNNNNNNSNSSCIIQYDSTSESSNNEIYAADGIPTVW